MLSLSPLTIVTAVAAAYFLPGVIAVLRGKRHQWTILALDSLLGWTLVGWVGALWWALSSDKPAVAKPKAAPRARPAPREQRPATRRDADIHANDNAHERAARQRFVWDDQVIAESQPDVYADWLDSGAALATPHEPAHPAAQQGHGIAA